MCVGADAPERSRAPKWSICTGTERRRTAVKPTFASLLPGNASGYQPSSPKQMHWGGEHSINKHAHTLSLLPHPQLRFALYAHLLLTSSAQNTPSGFIASNRPELGPSLANLWVSRVALQSPGPKLGTPAWSFGASRKLQPWGPRSDQRRLCYYFVGLAARLSSPAN